MWNCDFHEEIHLLHFLNYIISCIATWPRSTHLWSFWGQKKAKNLKSSDCDALENTSWPLRNNVKGLTDFEMWVVSAATNTKHGIYWKIMVLEEVLRMRKTVDASCVFKVWYDHNSNWKQTSTARFLFRLYLVEQETFHNKIENSQ